MTTSEAKVRNSMALVGAVMYNKLGLAQECQTCNAESAHAALHLQHQLETCANAMHQYSFNVATCDGGAIKSGQRQMQRSMRGLRSAMKQHGECLPTGSREQLKRLVVEMYAFSKDKM